MEPKAKTIIERFGFSDPDLKTPIHDEMLLWLNKNWMKVLKETLSKNFNFKVIKNMNIKWEYPIMGGYNKKYNIGFVDFMLLKEEYQRGGKLVPIIKIPFEIKPKIKSIGELVRQINMYRSQEKFTWFIILTKTKGLKELLKSQEILVYEYEKGQQTLK